MPSINDVLNKKAPFKKKSYRPYLTLDEVDGEAQSQASPPAEPSAASNTTAATEQAQQAAKLQADRERQEQERIALEQRAENERRAAAAKEAEARLLSERKALEEKLQQERQAALLEQERLESERKAAAEKLAREVAAAAQKAEQERLAREEKARAEETERLRKAAERKLEQERLEQARLATVAATAEPTSQGQGIAHEQDRYLRLSSIVGKQLEVLSFLYKETLNSREKLITDELSTEDIARGVQYGAEQLRAVQTALSSLKKAGAISTHEYKSGWGGWSRYRINRHLHDQLISRDKAGTLAHLGSDSAVNKPMSPRPVVIEPDFSTELNSEWQSIDIEEARVYGFTETHLKQLFDGQLRENEKSRGRPPLNAEQIQSSLDAWSFARRTNKSQAGLNVFMGVVRNRGEWTPCEGFRTRKAIAAERREQIMRDEIEAIRKAEATERELSFLKWKQALPADEQLRIVRSSSFGFSSLPGSKIFNEALRYHFDNSSGATGASSQDDPQVGSYVRGLIDERFGPEPGMETK